MINSTSRDFVSTCPICNANPLDLHCPICDIELEGDSSNLHICKYCLLDSFKANDYIFQCPHCKKPLEIVTFIHMLTHSEINEIFENITDRIFKDEISQVLSTKVDDLTLYYIISMDCKYIFDNIETIYQLYLMILIKSPSISHITRNAKYFKFKNFNISWRDINRLEQGNDYDSISDMEKMIDELRYSRKKVNRNYPIISMFNKLNLKPIITFMLFNLFSVSKRSITDITIDDVEKLKTKIFEQFMERVDFYNKDPLFVKHKVLFKCTNGNCCGLVNNNYICPICDCEYCKKCGLINNEFHTQIECELNSSSFKFIMSTTQSCPKCGLRINKSEGCDVMFCTFCHICFSYRTGEELKGNLHNPHRLEWLKSMDKPATFNENENGVCIDVRDYEFLNLRSFSLVRDGILRFQSLANLLYDKIDTRNINEYVRKYIIDGMLPNISCDINDKLKIMNLIFKQMRIIEIEELIRVLADSIIDCLQFFSQITEINDESQRIYDNMSDFIYSTFTDIVKVSDKLGITPTYFNDMEYCLCGITDIINKYGCKNPYGIIHRISGYTVLKKPILLNQIGNDEYSVVPILEYKPILCEYVDSSNQHSIKFVDSSINQFVDSKNQQIWIYKWIKEYESYTSTLTPTNYVNNTKVVVAMESYDVFKNGFDDESFNEYIKLDLWIGSIFNYMLMNIYVGKPLNLPEISSAKPLCAYEKLKHRTYYEATKPKKDEFNAFVSPFVFYINPPISRFAQFHRNILDILHVECMVRDVFDKNKFITFAIFNYIMVNQYYLSRETRENYQYFE